MANVNVTYQELSDTASKLSNGQADIEGKLSELKGSVDQLIAAGFQTDKASGAFASAYDEFTSGATKTIEGLEGMSKFLKAAADAFTQVDDQLSSAIKG
jgi:WXG100 family type VII secretion target